MDSGPTNDASEKKGKSASDKQTLIPLTIGVFKQASTSDEETIQIDGREINQVTIVGKIDNIVEQSTYVNYALDDGTGSIEVRFWLDSDESEYMRSERAKLQRGRYARIVGYPRKFNNERSLVAMHIAPVTDFNEITFHGLEVMAVHLQAPQNAGVAASHPPVGHIKQEAGQPNGAMAMPAAPHTNGGQDRVTQSVLQCMKECQDEAGMHIDQVVSVLAPQGFSAQQIRDAIEHLSSECLVYTTIDDDHYKFTA